MKRKPANRVCWLQNHRLVSHCVVVCSGSCLGFLLWSYDDAFPQVGNFLFEASVSVSVFKRSTVYY